jgi:hypothetical protein
MFNLDNLKIKPIVGKHKRVVVKLNLKNKKGKEKKINENENENENEKNTDLSDLPVLVDEHGYDSEGVYHAISDEDDEDDIPISNIGIKIIDEREINENYDYDKLLSKIRHILPVKQMDYTKQLVFPPTPPIVNKNVDIHSTLTPTNTLSTIIVDDGVNNVINDNVGENVENVENVVGDVVGDIVDDVVWGDITPLPKSKNAKKSQKSKPLKPVKPLKITKNGKVLLKPVKPLKITKLLKDTPVVESVDVVIDDDTDIISTEIINKPPKVSSASNTSVKYTTTHLNMNLLDDVVNDDDIDITSYGSIMPKTKEKFIVKSDYYYMNNKKRFPGFISKLFKSYADEAVSEKNTFTCDGSTKQEKFELLMHQKIVRDYINIQTPYRGLLLLHGLGSGKTCSSIGIAEGLKNSTKIVIMTPASLKRNYIEEIKKCGDEMYKKKQYWEWVNLKTDTTKNLDKKLSKLLNLSLSFIRKQGGAWMVNVNKKSNYKSEIAISVKKLKSLNEQLDKMIMNKYKFISYNGLNLKKMNELTKNDKINPFDNSIVIIDEVHNLISRIVNKLKLKNVNKKGANQPISLRIYNYLKNAKNIRIIMLTGTPIINYPNEIAILFNILRGDIKTWSFNKITIKGPVKITTELFKNMFLHEKSNDYINYNPTLKTLSISRNPMRFKNKIIDKTYNGVYTNATNKDETDEFDINYVSDDDYANKIIDILSKSNVKFSKMTIENNNALPDKIEEFNTRFVSSSDGNMVLNNPSLFKRRIMGLTSYFRSAQESLLPRFNPETDIIIERVEMSNFQNLIYKEYLLSEQSKFTGNDNDDDDVKNTYKILTRLASNFVPPSNIKRPWPEKLMVGDNTSEVDTNNNLDENEPVNNQKNQKKKKGANKTDTDITKHNYKKGDDDLNTEMVEDGDALMTDNIAEKDKQKYFNELNEMFDMLKKDSSDYFSLDNLQQYSAKFFKILQNILNPDNIGLHLIYSQFRTVEGIGILKLILEENGFAQFKVKKNRLGGWDLDISDEDKEKPKFAFYTGTETAEEKELIRNIYNNSWEDVPPSIVKKLKENTPSGTKFTNQTGNIIKILMITSSGSEGINLRNTRFVHIVEPYWNYVRIEQVIGRARRICSHIELPDELRTVKVFLYLATSSSEPISTDEYLYNMALKKHLFNKEILKAIKETSIDCSIYPSNNKEGLQCLNMNNVSNKYSYVPNINNEPNDDVEQLNIKETTWVGKKITIDNTNYIYKDIGNNKMEIYDYDEYIKFTSNVNQPLPTLLFTLDKSPNKK